MSLIMKGKSNTVALEPETYPARLVQVIDIGKQQLFDFQTKELTQQKDRVILTFELPEERVIVNDEDIGPRWISREYTASDSELAGIVKVAKALSFDWTPEIPLSDLLGKPCQVSTGLTSGNKPKILDVVKLGKGMKVGELENPASFFDFDSPDIEMFNSFPEWLQDKIKEAVNFKGSKLETKLGESDSPEYNDDIPF